MTNNSPRIKQLKRKINYPNVEQSFDAETIIIGWWIAGTMTAYFLLSQTDQQITLVDAYKIAHWATGHNAGQIVGYFEKSFTEIVNQYGAKMALQAQKDISWARDLLETVIKTCQLKTPVSIFQWYAGCQTVDQIIEHLEKKLLRESGGIHIDTIQIDENWIKKNEIPKKYEHLYSTISSEKIKILLNTNQDDYIAVLSTKKWCTNSALLCEEILSYLQDNYPHRFRIYENTPVKKIDCFEKNIVLETESGCKMRAEKIILCTNGFESIEIKNHAGEDIDKKFHEMVEWVTGYMAGYLDKPDQEPTAISYFLRPWEMLESANDMDVYFYLTRRNYELENNKHSLICVGWPEVFLTEKTLYDRNHWYPEEHQQKIDKFLHQTYSPAPKGKIDYEFKRHWLMGYTHNWLRCIGPDPRNPRLFYNLWCNGVGILSSIFWGYKISQFMIWKVEEKSIFDPIYQ